MTKRVVIVGGGISGLTAAFTLSKSNPKLEIRLFEATGRLGGNIGTDSPDGFVVEHGPDSFVVSKPHALALCRELGLTDQLIRTPVENRVVYFVRGGRLVPLPEGLVLGVPTRLWPLLRTPLLTLKGKLRAALEPFIPVRTSSADESVHDFFRRRLGVEVAKRIANPLIGGIYAGDPYTLSLRATFPQFESMEQQYGSLVLGLLFARGSAQGTVPRTAIARLFTLLAQLVPKKRDDKPAFLSLKGGMKTLIDSLAKALPPDTVTLSAPVSAVELGVNNSEAKALITLTSGSQLEAHALLLATPVHKSAQLIPDPELQRELAQIDSISTATVVLAFERAAVAHPLQGLGFVVPEGEGQILAATWISSKWPHRAPQDSVLMRVFVGGPAREAQAELADATLIELALSELRRLMGRLDAPLWSRVYRYRQASPQPNLGHPERMQRVHNRLKAFPGLFLSAGGLDGIGIPDSVKHAQQVAESIAAQLK